MKKYIVSVLAIVLVLSLVFVGSSYSQATAKGTNIMEFNTMVGVSAPYTGAVNAIRGVPGGGAPWKISSVNGELKSSGKLEITVRGLVLVNTGTNPVANFRGLVSCQSKDANGAANIVNVSTGLFPASSTGNSEIEETLSLPSPCIAPIIFVTNPTGSWFAATGQ